MKASFLDGFSAPIDTQCGPNAGGWRAAVLLIFSSACARVPTTPPVPASPNTGISVEVRTAADTVARVARVAVTFDGDTVQQHLTSATPGVFTGPRPAAARRATLIVNVPDHWITEARILLPVEPTARLTIRPRALIPRDTLSRPRVFGDFNGFAESRAVLLQRGQDGRLRASVPFSGTSSRFSIYGVGGPDDGAWMPVTAYAQRRDSSVRDPFTGILAPVRDTLHFIVDPASFSASYKRPASIMTQTQDTALAMVNSLVLERHDAQMYRVMLQELRPSESDSTWTLARQHARALASTATDLRVRATALVTLMELYKPGEPRPVEDARAFLAAIPPGDPLLRDGDAISAASRATFFRDTTPFVNAADSTRRARERMALQRAYLQPLAQDRTLPEALRADAYTNLIFGAMGAVDQATLDAMIDEAVAAVPDDPTLKSMPASFGRLRTLREGAPFPTFTMRPVADTLSTPISNESFRGQVTLIDFWGMWCAPCVQEMPFLHAAYEKFSRRGFTILSIGTDPDLDRVAAFRKSKWPMPWLHGWAGEGPMAPALRALGVTAFPTAVLVDREGKIVAVNAGLRGAALERTLERLLQ